MQTWWLAFQNPEMRLTLGYAMESGIHYGQAFVKNAYVGRTFIKPARES